MTTNPFTHTYRKCMDKMGRIHGCGEVHPTVKVESDVEIGDIHYIDINKECPRAKDQYLDWEDVPNEHYDVIWPVYCPFYGILDP